MPREISRQPPLRSDPRDALREMATRARRLAWGADELTAARLNAFAEELEAKAKAAALDTAPQIFTHDAAAAMRRVEDDAG